MHLFKESTTFNEILLEFNSNNSKIQPFFLLSFLSDKIISFSLTHILLAQNDKDVDNYLTWVKEVASFILLAISVDISH